MTKNKKVFLECKDAGRVLGVSRVEIVRLATEGRLPVAARTVRGSRLFKPEDIDRAARERAKRLDTPVDRALRGGDYEER